VATDAGIALVTEAQALVDSGQYSEAMDKLTELDQVDDSFAKVTTNMRHQIAALDQEEVPTSAGTSFLTSESPQDKSGTSLPDTEPSSPSPAPAAESLSSEDQAASQVSSSTVPSTSGSTQETGVSQPSPSDSSVDSVLAKEATADQPDAESLMQLAREAFLEGDLEKTSELLDQAVAADPELEPDVQRARLAVVARREETGPVA